MATVWLIIGTIGFVAATVLFLYWATSAPAGTRHFYVITAVITGVAAFSYMMMSTGAGATLVGGDRLFYFFRYIDWLITTPLLLVDLALLALASPRRNIGTIATLIVLDVVMILTGLLAGSRESAAGRGFWFIVSTVAFVVLVYLIVTQLFAAARNASGYAQGLFSTLAYLTVVAVPDSVAAGNRRLRRGRHGHRGLPLPDTRLPRQDRLRHPAAHEPPGPDGGYRRIARALRSTLFRCGIRVRLRARSFATV